jgi:hypothetical protein
LYFNIINAPNPFFDSGDDPAPPEDAGRASPLTALDLAYVERADEYERELPKAYRKIVFSGMPDRPRHLGVGVDLPGEHLTVMFDRLLDGSLMRIYVVHGWAGIMLLELALESERKSSSSRSLHPWDLIVPFYLFTRNRLVLLIRNTLVELERRAATAALRNLGPIHEGLERGWATFLFPPEGPTLEPTEEQTVLRDGPGYSPATRMGNKSLSDRLVPLLADAVRCRQILLRKQDIFFGYEDGAPPTSAAQDLTEAQAAFAAACGKVEDVAPLALLAVPQLKEGFSRPDMENGLGLTLWRLKQDAGRLLRTIKADESQVAAMFPLPEGALDGRGLEGLYPFGHDLEKQCADKAIKLAEDSEVRLVLLSESIWLALFQELSQSGGLAHIVAAQYIAVLMTRLQEEASKKELTSNLWVRFEALLGLAAVVVPAMRIPAFFVGLYSSIYFSWRAIATLDEATKQMLAENNQTMTNLLALGELAVMRTEYGEQLTGALIRELALVVAGGCWTDFKRLMHLRGYYQDLENLLTAVRGVNTDG